MVPDPPGLCRDKHKERDEHDEPHAADDPGVSCHDDGRKTTDERADLSISIRVRLFATARFNLKE